MDGWLMPDGMISRSAPSRLLGAKRRRFGTRIRSAFIQIKASNCSMRVSVERSCFTRAGGGNYHDQATCQRRILGGAERLPHRDFQHLSSEGCPAEQRLAPKDRAIA